METVEVSAGVKEKAAGVVQNRRRRSDLSKYYNIVRELAIADFRLKYHDSALGYIWSMLNPLLLFAVYYFVFTRIFKSTLPHYPIFLLIGIINYAFFQDCTFSGMHSLGAKSGLIKKISFPKTLIILASTGTCFLSYLINMAVVLVIVLITKGFTPLVLLAPLPMLCLLVYSMGLSFLLATLYAYFRDIGQIWGVLVLVIFWLSPVVFDVETLVGPISSIVYFNPLTRIFVLMRHFLLYPYFDLRFLVMTMLYSAVFFVVGLGIFQKHQHRFPELF